MKLLNNSTSSEFFNSEYISALDPGKYIALGPGWSLKGLKVPFINNPVQSIFFFVLKRE